LNRLLQRPAVANMIIGARNEEGLRDNLGAVGWSLSPEQIKKLDAASQPPRIYAYWRQADFPEPNPPPV
jgi:aryl-alcohol dehydrogenase-like predicted oxidoreductase